MFTICLIPGDGVGREVIPAAAQVMAAVLSDVRFVEAEAGWECFLRRGTALPDETLAAVAAADGTLFGATQSPITGDLTPRPPFPPDLGGQGGGEESYRLIIGLDDPALRNPTIVQALVTQGAQIRFVNELRHSLEDVYLSLLRESQEVAP